MEKQRKWFLILSIILLWNGCEKERTKPDSDLLTSIAPVTITPMLSENKPTTEPTKTVSPTGAIEDAKLPSDENLPNYNPEEILRQTGGVVIPWGDRISVDMDGDGKKETVSMRLTLDSDLSGDDWLEALPVLTVDDAVFKEEDFQQLCYPQRDRGVGFNDPGWCILDIDTSDSYFEIAVGYSNWHRNSPRTCFLRYGEGGFTYVGSIEASVLNQTTLGDMPLREETRWETGEPDWEAARLQIWNAGNGLHPDVVKGDGIIYYSNAAYHNVLENCDESRTMIWRLENPEKLHAKLVLDPPYLDFGEPEYYECPEEYKYMEEFWNYMPYLKKLYQDTVFFQNKGGEDGATVMLPAGTEVWFRRYYLEEGRWVEMVYDEGGVYKEGAQSAWFQVLVEIEEDVSQYPKGMIRLPDKEIEPINCFGGGYIWGS